MIADLKPYAEYRNSGIPLIGQVPTHWDVVPLSRVAHQKVELEGTERQLLSVYLNRGVVRFEDVDEKRTNATSDDLGQYQAVSPGDLVLNNQQAWRGSVGVSRHSGIVSPAYFVMRLSSMLRPEYANLLFRDRCMVSQYLVCSKGIGTIQRNLYWPHLKRVGVIVPPAGEQAAIVHFLGWANGRLERAIRAKRKVIALLNEQKLAIVQQAVLRGLNPTGPTKASGVSWLGDVPAHWEVSRSKYLFREADERSESGDETHLSMSQKLGLVPNSAIGVRRLVSDSYAGAKLCTKGDLVLNRLKAHLGVFALAPQSGLVSPDYTVLRPIAEMEPRYFEAVYRSSACRAELRQRAKGIVQGFWRLYTGDFYDIRVPVPPVSEQVAIMESLAAPVEEVNRLIAKLEGEIDLLREYRTRLVADAVTGKFDVRSAPQPLTLAEQSDAEPDTDESAEEIDAADEELPA